MTRLLVACFLFALAGCSADSTPPTPAKPAATPPPAAKGGKAKAVTMD